MKIIKTEHKLCSSCNEVHDVSTVAVLESTKINNKYIRYNAEYEFCEFNNCLVDSTELRKKNRLHRTNDEKKLIEIAQKKDGVL